MAVEARPCVLTGYSGRRTAARVSLVTYDRRQRLGRAFRGLGTWWAAALGSVFIPVAHFLLVPSFLLYGALTFTQRLGAAVVAVAGEGTCPDCGSEQALDVRGRWRAPRDISCRHCQRNLTLAEAG